MAVGKKKKDYTVYGDLCITMMKQKGAEAGDDRLNLRVTERANLEELIESARYMSVIALNQDYTVPDKFVTKDMVNFPKPFRIDLALKECPKLLNRITFNLGPGFNNFDNLMHALTKKTVCSDFDLIAIRPYNTEQLMAFFKCNNVVYDIVCLDMAELETIQSFKSDLFTNGKQQKLFFEIRYCPVISDKANVRINLLMAANAQLRFAKRFCKNFILSSGMKIQTETVSNASIMRDLADMCGFREKIFRLAIDTNIRRCLEEAELRRCACPAVTVAPLKPEMKTHWTYLHESRLTIRKFLDQESAHSSEETEVSEVEPDSKSDLIENVANLSEKTSNFSEDVLKESDAKAKTIDKESPKKKKKRKIEQNSDIVADHASIDEANSGKEIETSQLNKSPQKKKKKNKVQFDEEIVGNNATIESKVMGSKESLSSEIGNGAPPVSPRKSKKRKVNADNSETVELQI